MGALVSLVIIMLVCFVLPFLLFYILYRYADGRVKTFLIGAVAYLVTGVIIDTSIAAFAALILWLFSLKSEKLGRICGVVMLCCYAAYFAFILFLK